MKLTLGLSASLLLLASAAHGQHSLAMHTHTGTGSASACVAGRYDGAIDAYSFDASISINHKVSTSNPDAQKFFNQGLMFFYGFDSESAMRSFHKAASLDPNLAMAHWGLALAAGGDLNIPIDDPCMRLAVEEITQANKLLANAPAEEQLYIKALAERYSPQAGSDVRDTRQLGVHYAIAMKSVYDQLGKKDPDVGALYAYSLMNLRPWLWWTTSGQASTEITDALEVLNASLKKFPRHIGLNHIQIHALEEGPVADAHKAEAAAKFLFDNAPSATPHLRHMPAHTFLLLGDWEKVIQANTNAVEADKPWAEKCQDITSPQCNQLLVGHYSSHDMLFLAVGYGNRGDWAKVQSLADELEANARKYIGSQPGLEHYLTTQAMMMVHFGKWDLLSKLPPPQSPMPPVDDKSCANLKYKLASAMWYFGRAMSGASSKQPIDDDIKGFQQASNCVQGAGLGWGNNSASDILNVVHWRLLERIARKSGRMDASRVFAQLAVETEDLLNYDEPPGWYLSSRETHGATLYLDKRYDGAIRVFQEDLKRRPNNSRSLYGIWKAREAQRSSLAKAAKAEFMKQWTSADLPAMEDM